MDEKSGFLSTDATYGASPWLGGVMEYIVVTKQTSPFHFTLAAMLLCEMLFTQALTGIHYTRPEIKDVQLGNKFFKSNKTPVS